jgi:hypothetical protein
MKTLEQWDKEMLELNHKIMELRTELAIYEGRRQKLFDERRKMVLELQAQLNEKDKENRK